VEVFTRHDILTRELARRRAFAVRGIGAADMRQQGEPSVSGQEVADAYGLLTYYTRRPWVGAMREIGVVGRSGHGCWLAPTAHAACMVPYNLGLDSPRDTCLLVDVSSVSALWGPGTSPPSSIYPSLWIGGGVEFYCPPEEVIPYSAVVQEIDIDPCGDRV
jgi:hypothetical protein